ncbi:MAG: AIR synthase family protein [Candidatus Bathyarchaeia archaeon]
MRPFRTGKIPTDILVRTVLRYRGRNDPSVILGSSIGEDAALVSFRGKVLVFTTDPVTGTASDIGWLSVHINANDIACRGARPRWFLCDLLLPEKSNARTVELIMRQVDAAAKELRVAVVGGHTEVTPGLKKPIVVGYMVGVVDEKKFITSSGARPNHNLIMTKSAGIEGTALLAMDFSRRLKVDNKVLARAKGLRHSISIVGDAMVAVGVGGVSAMHDPTEGGVLQGIWEIAEASKVGFLVDETKIAMRDETRRICAMLHVDPLRLMSSGCLLIAADNRKANHIVRRLRQKGIEAEIIGKFTDRKKGRKLVRADGSTTEITASERDELYRVIETHGS